MQLPHQPPTARPATSTSIAAWPLLTQCKVHNAIFKGWPEWFPAAPGTPPPPPPRPHLRVELEVDNLAARQRDGHLPLVGGRLDDGLAPRRAPLIDAPVGADVAQAGGVDLRLGGGGATSRGPAAGQHAGRAPRRAGNSMHRHRLDGLLGACRRLALTLPTSVFSPCGSACSHQEPPSPACAPEASSRRPAAGCAGWARCR